MKSRTKPALRVVPAAHVQQSLPMQGVLQDVKHAFYGFWDIAAGHDSVRRCDWRHTGCGSSPERAAVALQVLSLVTTTRCT
jgi:hypothetical protein